MGFYLPDRWLNQIYHSVPPLKWISEALIISLKSTKHTKRGFRQGALKTWKAIILLICQQYKFKAHNIGLGAQLIDNFFHCFNAQASCNLIGKLWSLKGNHLSPLVGYHPIERLFWFYPKKWSEAVNFLQQAMHCCILSSHLVCVLSEWCTIQGQYRITHHRKCTDICTVVKTESVQ